MSERTETEIKSMTKEQNYMCGYRDGKSDVLDKIYNEISHLTFRPYESRDTLDRRDVMEILGKYRAKSEEVE